MYTRIKVCIRKKVYVCMWYDVCDMMCVGCEEPEALHTSAYVIIKKKLLDQEGRVPEPLRQTSFLKNEFFI